MTDNDDQIVKEPADTIDIPDGEKVTFTDNPDGTPVDTSAETGAVDDQVVDDPPAGQADEEGQRPRRNKKDFQTRINELTRRAHENEERAAAAEAAAELVRQELEEERKRYRTESEEATSQREKDIIERKKAALEGNDMAAYDAAQDELLELRLQRARQPETKAEAPKQKVDAQPKRDPAADAWLARNAWTADKENQSLMAEAVRIERRLVADGMQLGEELYKKLDEELAKLPEFDDVRAVRQQPKPAEAQGERPRSVVAPPNRGNDPPPKPREGALTEYDKATMKRYMLDPNNPQHRASYLKRKLKSA